jgi:hypothetical protein
MTIAEQIQTKLATLPEEQQRQVLELVEDLASRSGGPHRGAYGCCADLRTDLPFAEFKKHRQALWGNSTV